MVPLQRNSFRLLIHFYITCNWFSFITFTRILFCYNLPGSPELGSYSSEQDLGNGLVRQSLL